MSMPDAITWYGNFLGNLGLKKLNQLQCETSLFIILVFYFVIMIYSGRYYATGDSRIFLCGIEKAERQVFSFSPSLIRFSSV